MDLVQELGFSQDGNRYDATVSRPHAHLICVQCRKIVDAEAELLSNLADTVAKRAGYRLMGQRVEFYGLCPECQNLA